MIQMKHMMLAGALASGVVGHAMAADTAKAEGLKVAVFDAQQVMNATNAAKKAVASLTSKQEAAQGKIDALKKPLMEKQKKLREQQTVMAADKFQTAQEAFTKDLMEFRTKAAEIQDGLDEENARLRKQISDVVRSTVEQIAKQKGYDLVVPKGMTFYAAPTIADISADVLEKANKALDK